MSHGVTGEGERFMRKERKGENERGSVGKERERKNRTDDGYVRARGGERERDRALIITSKY